MGHTKAAGITHRLAWLADIALAIGFPGGCRKGPLERFLREANLPGESDPWDDLGKPATEPPTSPIWRRWRIAYDADLSQFRQRAEHIYSLRIGSATRVATPRSHVIGIARRRPAPADSSPSPSPPPVKPRGPKKGVLKRATPVRRRRRPDDR